MLQSKVSPQSMLALVHMSCECVAVHLYMFLKVCVHACALPLSLLVHAWFGWSQPTTDEVESLSGHGT